MTAHIGIVGCSAEGAALCYKTICVEGAAFLGPHAHPEVSLHTPSLADYVACLEAGDLQGVASLMLTSANILAEAGADILICPDNTIHQAFDLVAGKSPKPWLHIADIVAEEAQQRGFRRLALLGTRWLVESDVYPVRLKARGIDTHLPSPSQRGEVNHIIMDELVNSRFEDASLNTLLAIIEEMKTENCDGAILGCTELPLVLNDENSALPTLDSTRLLARAALLKAIEP